MRRPRLRYTPEELADAVQKVLGGSNGKHVSLYTKIPYNTLMRIVRQTKAGTNKAPQRRGPKPVLPAECERDLVEWIVAMQQDGHPPDRDDILVKANKLAREQRHPELTERSAQVISHSRNFVDMDGVNHSGSMYTISKTVALRIASRAWTSHIVPTNVISGFRTTGLCPLSHDQMVKRYSLFNDCGVPRSYLHADWIVRRQVIRAVILCLPARETKTRGSSRKTADVGGRLLTLALLHKMDATKKERFEAAQRKKALKAKRKNKRGGIVLSPLALKWASIAAKLGMAPLSNGTVMSCEATEVVV
ncbi:hypothetical protein DYB25_010101 [Aphanomyces astaci]|uniref:HTH CENPB-type domain-containing protein n=1 Tax=Aphanomyces astaci TaxID=112090 RepID=A0A397AEV4_APHAT|nr:hypothetical protein DYB25_010101 [Aphanomyces astaci]